MEPVHIHSERTIERSTGKLNTLARIFSDLANPILVPPAVLAIMGFTLNIPALQLTLTLAIALLFYSLIPFGAALILLKKGSIQSLDVPLKQNREQLFLYSIGSIMAGSLFLINLNFGSIPILAESAFIFLANAMIGYGLNLKKKISIHAASMASAGILLLYLQLHLNGGSFWPEILSLFTLLVLLPLMCWARYRLGIHNTAELLGGSLAGLFFTLLQVSILNIIW